MENKQKILGVIGGLGPAATAYFMELVTRMTDAAHDQEHLEMLIHSCPSIPDRTGYILDPTGPSPLPRMIAVGNDLASQGAAWIAIPCVTAHYFYEALNENIHASIVNGVGETVNHLKAHGITKVGVMATDGTIRTGLFAQQLRLKDMEPIIPTEESQAKVMQLIYGDIKANKPAEMELFYQVSQELRSRGAQAIILGCTELSLIKRDYPIGAGYIDAMEVLAQQSVIRCGGKLKKEFECLISD